MSAKKEHLIKTAFELFYQKGVHAVGINEILSASGVAKKTLYNHFPSKEALILAAVQYRDKHFRDWLKHRLNGAEDGRAKVEALFAAIDDWFNNRTGKLLPFQGCFFINVGGEYGQPDDPIHQQCALHKRKIEQMIADIVQPLQLDSAQAQQLTNALCLLKEGAISQAHIAGDKQAALKAGQTARQLMVAYRC
ncbi:TetR/AcrR family transcriptional regulator [Ferrimonas sp. YFM]|uniref:TetR/AcrR family transcriptional regulator n=1 Tax=Ferrimonas sp. YFM TaxID=3028878 RepID=UPI00257272DD|nr:TetR/AcrR family transcriptional regulator [Ferrimonas sp. YFM]BDY05404.1 TetR family transcriptional regulator [Ferrimonas sp. YFM]